MQPETGNATNTGTELTPDGGRQQPNNRPGGRGLQPGRRPGGRGDTNPQRPVGRHWGTVQTAAAAPFNKWGIPRQQAGATEMPENEATESPEYEPAESPEYESPEYEAAESPEYESPEYEAAESPEYESPEYESPEYEGGGGGTGGAVPWYRRNRQGPADLVGTKPPKLSPTDKDELKTAIMKIVTILSGLLFVIIIVAVAIVVVVKRRKSS